MGQSNLSITPVDIAISGMRAESMRMRVTANNIANAQNTRSADGGPYRRQQLIIGSAEADDVEKLGGVEIRQITADSTTPFESVYLPGHPDANEEGFVQFPNVSVPQELMELTAASRAYQANAAVMKRHMEISGVALELLR